ncbi:MAG: DUF4132 domain-containing protein [Myxococcales bacterium]|nr:DUF4132 domain-containing protein [Myxococcales bacterium]
MPIEIRPETRPDDIQLPPALEATHTLHRDHYDDAKTQVKTVWAARNDAPTVKDGPLVTFRRDGRAWSEEEYQDGKLWTIHVLFGESGAPLDHGTRKDGEGIQRAYHENDTLRAEGPCTSGRSEGTWRYWFQDGTLQAEGDFRAGAKTGPWRYFNADGSLRLEEDYRDDESVWVVYWHQGQKSREGLRRKTPEGHWGDDGPWSCYEGGELKHTDLYHQGNYVRRVPNPGPVIAAMRSKGDPAAQLQAIKKVAEHTSPCEFLEPLHATGEVSAELALSIAIEAYSHLWDRVFPIVLSYGDAMHAPLDAAAERLTAESYPNDNQCVVLCLWRWELSGKTPLPALYEPLLKRALSYNAELSDHKRPTVERLRELVKSYPREAREALVLNQRGKPLFAYAGLAATPETVQATIDEIATLKKNVFRYNPSRAISLKAMLEEVGELAIPGLVATLKGAGKKAQARQIYVEVLAKSGAPEAAAVLLDFVHDKVDEAARAAREGLQALGEAALPAIEDALGAKAKALKLAAAETLSKMEPTDAVRAVAERRLAAEKNAELRALLEPIAAGASGEPTPEALPAAYAAILADRAALADRRDEVLAALEGQESYAHVQAFLAEKLAEDPRFAVLFMERVGAELRKEAPRLHGLEHGKILWPLHKLGAFERIAWLAAEMLSVMPEKGGHNVKYLVKDLYRNARPLDSKYDPIPEETPGPFPQALAFFLSRGEPVPAKKPLLAWLEENAPSVSAAAFAAHVEDAAKPVRDVAIRGLITSADAAIEVTLPLLAGSTKQQAAAAEVLRAVPRAASVAPLEAALKKEKNAKRREALESALLSCRLAAGALDVDTLDATLSARAPATAEPPKDMPALRWRGGKPVSEAATRWLLAALRTEDGSGPPNAELAGVRSQLEDEPAHALCRAILATYPETSADRWVRYQRALLGDDAAMDGLGKMLASDVYRFSADFAAHGVEVLRRNPTPAAVRWLEHYSHRSKGKLEREAERAIRSLTSGELSRDDLVDRSMPRIDDEASRALVAERLEIAMCTARRWTLDAWRDFVLGNAATAALAPQLLFACYDGGELHPFRVLDGAPVDREGAPFELRGEIGVPHPVELDESTIDAWIDVFDAPPFEQLDRPCTPDASEVLSKAMPAPPLVAGELLDALEANGFVADNPEDAGLVWGARKRFGPRWTLRVSHTSYSASSRRPVEGSTLTVQGLHVEGDGVVPAALWSEALQTARRLVPTLA